MDNFAARNTDREFLRREAQAIANGARNRYSADQITPEMEDAYQQAAAARAAEPPTFEKRPPLVVIHPPKRQARARREPAPPKPNPQPDRPGELETTMAGLLGRFTLGTILDAAWAADKTAWNARNGARA